MATLNVGPGQSFTRLSDAISASSDGDLIRVQAGTYTNDFATINKKLTIQGVGGMAKLVATEQPSNGKGILVTQNDVTLDHVEISGARVSDQNGAAIRHENGSLTLNSVYIHGNENGLLAGDNGNSRITITNSEFASNGRGDGSTHNLYANKIANLTIRGSYFHDASVGHEIKSRASETVIEGNRIVNGANGTASYNIDLPNGGRATVRDNVIEEGPKSQNPNTIHFGGEGSAYSDSSLLVTGNTVVSDRDGAYLVLNQTNAAATLTKNTIYGYSSDRILRGPGSASDNTTASSRPAVDTRPVDFGSAPASSTTSTPAPAPTTPAPTTPAPAPTTSDSSSSDSGTLVVRLSGDNWQGNPRFTVRLDGQEMGSPQEVTALHAAGQSQAFTFTGGFGGGSHTVGVTFLNDAYAGTPSTDRNLYVDGITLNGAAVPNATATLFSAGTANFAANAGSGGSALTAGAALTAPSGTLTLRLSGDEWQGRAQFIVSVDGQEMGSAQEVTAERGAGQSQEFTFDGNFGDGPHAVSVRFLNDAYAGTPSTDRNLYVEGMTFNGVSVPSATAALYSAGSASFTILGVASATPTTPTAPASGAYVLEGPTWPDRDLTWSFATTTYEQDAGAPFSNPITGAYQASIRQAVQKWESVSGLDFTEVADAPSRSEAADIRIGFADMGSSGSGVLGYANYRYTSGSTQTFVPNATVRIADPSGMPLEARADGGFQYKGYAATLYQVALHEIGHTLGLGHSSDENSIMHGSLSDAGKNLNGTDIAGIQKLYGGSSGAAVTVDAAVTEGAGALAGINMTPETLQSQDLAFMHDHASHGELDGAHDDGALFEELGAQYAGATTAPSAEPAWKQMIPDSSAAGVSLADAGEWQVLDAATDPLPTGTKMDFALFA